MIHRNRRYCITPKGTVHALALALAKGNWTMCTGFSVEGGRLVALNDSFTPDSIQEFAILLRGTDGGYRQVESLTCSWMKSPGIERLLRDLLDGTYPRGTYDDDPTAGLVVASSQAQLLMALGVASEAEVAEPSLPGVERPSAMSPYLVHELSKPALVFRTHGSELCDHCR